MSPEILIPLFSALAGAIIGSAGSVITVLIQVRANQRTELVRLSTQAAIETFKANHDLASELISHSQHGESKLVLRPLTTYLYGFQGHLNMLRKGNVNKEDIEKFLQDIKEIEEILIGADK